MIFKWAFWRSCVCHRVRNTSFPKNFTHNDPCWKHRSLMDQELVISSGVDSNELIELPHCMIRESCLVILNSVNKTTWRIFKQNDQHNEKYSYFTKKYENEKRKKINHLPKWHYFLWIFVILLSDGNHFSKYKLERLQWLFITAYVKNRD